MKKLIVFPLMAAGLFTLGSCNQTASRKATPGEIAAIPSANFDSAVAPGTDFYQYACGGWMKDNPLKPEYACFGRFDQLRETNQEQVQTLIIDVSNTPQAEGSAGAKIGLLYSMGMDSVKLQQQGWEPIKDQLDSIAQITNKDELTKVVAMLHREGMAPYFAFYISADEKNSDMNMAHVYQAGINMGDRDYYLLEDDATKKIREAYLAYITKLFTLTGRTPAKAAEAAASVLKIETQIAQFSKSREALRDSQSNYRKMALKQFKMLHNPLNWDLYFESMGVMELEYLDVKQLSFYEGLEGMMKFTPISEQKDYLAFNLISAAAPYLSDEFVAANFDFYGKTLSGREEQQPRWKRTLNTVNGALGEAVGQLYVAKYFPASSKEKMLKMVSDLQKALGDRIAGLEWMGDSTKQKAQEKLTTFIVKIGYPDKWRDYSGLEIKDDSYWANVRRSNIFDYEYMLADYNQPVDRSRWHMNPQTVNAYYNPTTNEICFPAGILQPPFYDPEADDAVNYGAIGVVIGHEMTHGFDDQGRNYDKDGNMTDWWTAEDSERFNQLADKLVAQYDAIIVLDTVHANGRYTLGENIADQGGLMVAHLGYLNTLDGKTPEPINGLTYEQRFYLGYANLWAQNVRPEEILRLTKIDPHSLGKWRVHAALRNIDAFYDAFHIKEGEPMFMPKSERVIIW